MLKNDQKKNAKRGNTSVTPKNFDSNGTKPSKLRSKSTNFKINLRTQITKTITKIKKKSA
jgi:hypothetical protein